MTNCPHCGQPMETDLERIAKSLPGYQRQIFEYVAKAGPAGIETSHLFDRLYGHRANGGSHMKSLHVLVYVLNLKLAPLGKEIRAGRGLRSGYRLQDVT